MAKTQSPKSAEEKPKSVRRKSAPKPVNSGVKPKRPVGRPTDYSEEIADTICLQLAEGRSLNLICHDEGMPDKSTVFRWLYRHVEFRDKYRAAREAQTFCVEDELGEIADDGRNDWMEKHNQRGEFIGWQINGEAVARSKLRFEYRRWLLERMQPKRFGVKSEMTLKGDEENPLQMTTKVVIVPQKQPSTVETKPLKNDDGGD